MNNSLGLPSLMNLSNPEAIKSAEPNTAVT